MGKYGIDLAEFANIPTGVLCRDEDAREAGQNKEEGWGWVLHGGQYKDREVKSDYIASLQALTD